MKGVTFNKEANMWRGMLAIEKKEHCKYFMSEYEAVKYCIKLRDARKHLIQPGSRNSIKKSDATAKDLPVGLHQTSDLYKGEKIPCIRCHIVLLTGKVKGISAYYGKLRSRKKAIEIVQNKRLLWVLENNHLLKNKY